MNLFFIPQPQRCICLTGSADIGRETPVVLCMPQPDERLVLAAGKLFEHVRTEQSFIPLKARPIPAPALQSSPLKTLSAEYFPGFPSERAPTPPDR